MSIRVACANGHKLVAPDNRAGMVVVCPRCEDRVLVPGIRTVGVVIDLPAPKRKSRSKRKKPVFRSPEETADAIAAGEAKAAAENIARSERVAEVAQPAPPPAATSVARSSSSPGMNLPVPTLPSPVVSSRPPVPAPHVHVAAKGMVPSIPRTALSQTRPISGRIVPWEPDAAKQTEALYSGMAITALAVFSMAPAMWEWFIVWQNPEGGIMPPWVYVLMLGALIQIAFSVYLTQIPDYSAFWSATFLSLATAAVYAVLLGMTLLGRNEIELAALLGFSDKLAGNRAAMWCCVMLCLSCVLCYFLGLSALRTHRSVETLRRALAKR